MVASFVSGCLVVVLGAVAACDAKLQFTIARDVERDIERQWGISASVECPDKLPMAGEVITCSMTHEGESYVVRADVDKKEISIIGADSVLFPKSALESVVGVPISCSDRRHLRVELGKSGYCKIAGSPTYLRVTLESLEPPKWSPARVLAEDMPADARLN